MLLLPHHSNRRHLIAACSRSDPGLGVHRLSGQTLLTVEKPDQMQCVATGLPCADLTQHAVVCRAPAGDRC
jgi:hypothetical protein